MLMRCFCCCMSFLSKFHWFSPVDRLYSLWLTIYDDTQALIHTGDRIKREPLEWFSFFWFGLFLQFLLPARFFSFNSNHYSKNFFLEYIRNYKYLYCRAVVHFYCMSATVRCGFFFSFFFPSRIHCDDIERFFPFKTITIEKKHS